nr:Chain A, OMEGA-CONOTOXIN TXVII [synthetic construct]
CKQADEPCDVFSLDCCTGICLGVCMW